MPCRGDVGKIKEISRMGSMELSVEWTIRLCPLLSSGNDDWDDWYTSPYFRIGRIRWGLRMWPNCERERNPTSGWLRLDLVRLDGGPSRTTFHFSVGIRGALGMEKSREGEREFSNYECQHWDDFCSRHELAEHRTRLMPDGVLNITCVLKRYSVAEGVCSVPRPSVEVDTAIRCQSSEKQGVCPVPHPSVEADPAIRCLSSEKQGFDGSNAVGPGAPCAGESLKHFFSYFSLGSGGGNGEDLRAPRIEGFVGGNGGDLRTPGTEVFGKDKEGGLRASGTEGIKESKSGGLEEPGIEGNDESNGEGIGAPGIEGINGSNDGGSGAPGTEAYEQLKKELESLKEQNKDLKRICEEQSLNISKASSELRKACIENELHKKEMESLMGRIESLERTVINCDLKLENYRKQNSTLESEILSISAEQYKCQDKLTIASGLVKAAFGDDAEEKKNENSDENNEKSKFKMNVKKLSQVKNSKKISLPTRHGNVIRSLKAIRAEGRRADFALKTGGSEWPVHRAILEGRSGHFETLFRGEWAQRDEVRIDDVAEDTLDRLLLFVYTGEVGDVSVGKMCEIYPAAHRFLLRDLESLCVEYMKREMCPEIVCGALTIAGIHGEADLKESALSCFFRECSRIVNRKEWAEFKKNHPEIIGELFEEFIKRERNNRRKEQK